MPKQTKRASLVALVQRYFGTLQRLDERYHRDVDALLALFEDDIDYRIPFHDDPIAWRGKVVLRPFLESMQGLFSDIHYALGEMIVDCARQTVVVEVDSRRLLRPTGSAYSNSYVFVITVRRDRIAVLHEYANPMAAKALAQYLNFGSQSSA